MAATTGLVHHQGRSVWLGVERQGIEPWCQRLPAWGLER